MENALWVVGDGGHAKSIIGVLESLGKPVSDAKHIVNKLGLQGLGQNVISESEALDSKAMAHGEVFFGFVGDQLGARQQKIEELESKGVKFSGFSAPTALLSRRAVIEDSAQIFEGSYVGPGSSIGRHCVVNTGATIEHDCLIGDFSHISVRAILLGSVQIGEKVYVGGGAVLLPGIKVGDGATIGAGSVVTRDVPPNSKVLGSPARPTT